MSENVEISKRAFDAFSRGDFDGALELTDPEIEWHAAFVLPDQVFHGQDEVRKLWDEFRSVWTQLEADVEEVLYDHDDVLIERVRFCGRGGGSGVEVDRVLHYVLELQEGVLRRLRGYASEAEAFAAAGVER